MSDDVERLVRVERAKELMTDMMEMQKEAFKVAAGQAINNGLAKALKSNNLTVEDWQRIYTSAPETTLRKQEEQMEKFAEKLIRKAQRGQRAPDDRPSDSAASIRQGGQRPRASDSLDLGSIVDSRKSGKMSSEQALDAMLKSTLGDYFKRTMSSD